MATQDPRLYRGLVVTDKARRVVQFHDKTVQATAEIIASAGLRHTTGLTRTHIYRRVSQAVVQQYDQIFPYLKRGCLLTDEPPADWRLYLEEADADSFMPRRCLTRIEQRNCGVEPCRAPSRPTGDAP